MLPLLLRLPSSVGYHFQNRPLMYANVRMVKFFQDLSFYFGFKLFVHEDTSPSMLASICKQYVRLAILAVWVVYFEYGGLISPQSLSLSMLKAKWHCFIQMNGVSFLLSVLTMVSGNVRKD